MSILSNRSAAPEAYFGRRLAALALTGALCLPSLAWAAPRTVGLAEARSKYKVKVEVVGRDSPILLGATLTNPSAEDLTVVVPTGSPVFPRDKALQTYLTGLNPPIEVPAGGSVTVDITAICITGHKKPAPQASDGGYALLNPTTSTDRYTEIIVVANLQKDDAKKAPEGVGEFQRDDPERFWQWVTLWAIMSETNRWGPEKLQDAIEKDLARKKDPPPPEVRKETAKALTDEVAGEVDEVHARRAAMKDEGIDLVALDPTAKYRPKKKTG